MLKTEQKHVKVHYYAVVTGSRGIGVTLVNIEIINTKN